MIVKSLLIVSVAALDLPFMPRNSRAYQLMLNAKLAAESVENMPPVSLFEIRKLTAVTD